MTSLSFSISQMNLPTDCCGVIVSFLCIEDICSLCQTSKLMMEEVMDQLRYVESIAMQSLWIKTPTEMIGPRTKRLDVRLTEEGTVQCLRHVRLECKSIQALGVHLHPTLSVEAYAAMTLEFTDFFSSTPLQSLTLMLHMRPSEAVSLCIVRNCTMLRHIHTDAVCGDHIEELFASFKQLETAVIYPWHSSGKVVMSCSASEHLREICVYNKRHTLLLDFKRDSVFRRLEKIECRGSHCMPILPSDPKCLPALTTIVVEGLLDGYNEARFIHFAERAVSDGERKIALLRLGTIGCSFDEGFVLKLATEATPSVDVHPSSTIYHFLSLLFTPHMQRDLVSLDVSFDSVTDIGTIFAALKGMGSLRCLTARLEKGFPLDTMARTFQITIIHTGVFHRLTSLTIYVTGKQVGLLSTLHKHQSTTILASTNFGFGFHVAQRIIWV